MKGHADHIEREGLEKIVDNTAPGFNRRAFLKTVLGLLAGGSLTGLAAACGAATQLSSATSTGSTPSGASATTGAAAQPNGQLTVIVPSTIVSLDVHGAISADRSGHTMMRHVMEALVERDAGGSQFVPTLATTWQNPDPITWVFNLRQGVKHHDGSVFTANDVKASIERLQAQKGALAPQFASVDSIDASDPATLKIKTTVPLGTMLPNLSLVRIGPADKINQDGFFTKPIGTGPFVVDNFQSNAELQLQANPAYWGGQPGLKTLVFRDIPETAGRVTALQTGEADVAWSLPPDQLPALRQDNSLHFYPSPSYAYYFIWFNSKREPFTDPHVRQAMWYALDIDSIVRDLFQDVGQRATAPIPPTVFGYAPQQPYAYDPARAQQLLAQAGLSGGFDAGMMWAPGNNDPQARELSDALISNWNAVGARIKSVEEDSAQDLKDLLALNWDLDYQTNSVITGDADYTLGRLYHSRANRNGYANADLDKILDQAAQTVDQDQRKTLYAEACKIIWDDAVGIFPLDLLENYITRNRVQGFQPYVNQIPSFAEVTVSG